VYDVLAGVKVLEVSAWGFVPSAGAVLADWGADVIKVEPPTGDPMRGLINAGLIGDGPNFVWEIFNRGKKSIALDLREAKAREIVLALAAQADVYLTSYLPSTRQKLGLDVADIQAANPNIVFASGSGAGARGDDADKGGFDAITFWARGGVAWATTPPGYPRPAAQPAGAFGDSISGMTLAGGIAGALLRRTRTGEGAVVDVSLLGTAMWSMHMGIVGAAAFGAPVPPPEPADASTAPPMVMNPLVNNYRTSDGRWVALCMLQFEAYWPGFCDVTGRSDLLTDERFDSVEKRQQSYGAIAAELEAIFAERSLEEWRAVLAQQDGQWDVVQHVSELPTDPQAVANGFAQGVEYPGGRTLPLISSPVQFDGRPPALVPAPDFGAHTDDVLRDELGMTEDEILEAKISGGVV
jgi:crotonobetainyl-CoA:carnitine CoA-transferase CaiB-like acyl-CoA transferase